MHAMLAVTVAAVGLFLFVSYRHVGAVPAECDYCSVEKPECGPGLTCRMIRYRMANLGFMQLLRHSCRCIKDESSLDDYDCKFKAAFQEFKGIIANGDGGNCTRRERIQTLMNRW